MFWLWKWLLSGVVSGIALRFFTRAAEVSLADRAGIHIVWILPSLAVIVQIVCWAKIPSPTPAHKFLFWGPVSTLFTYGSAAAEIWGMLGFDRRYYMLITIPALTAWVVSTLLILTLAITVMRRARPRVMM